MNHDSSSNTYLASTVFMVKPKLFGFNGQTADTNAFQKNQHSYSDVHQTAMQEFSDSVNQLKSHGIDVIVFESNDAEAPDAIFPNNWFSTHQNGNLVLYPMYAPNRRRERNQSAIDLIQSHCNSKQVIDYSTKENEGFFLEGTGSIIFDHPTRNAYASLSQRTNKALFDTICQELNYTPISFTCSDPQGLPFYHTNVMLHIGNNYAVIYDEGIRNPNERKYVMDCLRESKKDIIHLSFNQVSSFAGNMLQLKNKQGTPYTVCSSTAYASLSAEQMAMLERHTSLLVFNIPIIEQIGGGSIRCMMAELF